MAVNKNFVVKHGLEVKTDLLVADANVSRVGIGTTLARHKLHVNGDVKIESNLQVVGVTSLGTNTRILTGTLEAGNTGVGTYGQFLVATGAGIAWTTAPNLRKQEIFTGTEGQKQFNFAHTIGFLDIFVNGVKLSTSEYTETAAFVTLLNGTSDGDTVELIGYYLFDNIGAANTTGIQGITVLEENAITGSPANVTSINFVGAHVTAAGTGAGVTVSFLGAGVGIGSSGTQIGYGFTNINFIGAGNTFKINGQSIDVSINSGSENYWVKSASGIHTTGRVGIGSTIPNSGVGLDVRDIIKTDTFFASPKVIDKNVDTVAQYNNFAVGPVSIENGRSIVVVPDSTLTFFGDSSGIYISGGDWRRTSVGIHTLSNVGIGTTLPRFELEVGAVGYADTSLWVNGNARVTGILTVGTSSIILDGNTDTITAGIVTAGKVFGVHALTFATGDYGTLTATTTDDFGVSILSQFDMLREPTGKIDTVDFGTIGEVVYDSISWAKSYAGIHTLSNVGIGTTLPGFELEVGAVGYADTSLWVNGNARIVDTVTAGKVFGVHALTFATGDYGALTATNIDDFGVSILSQFDMLREPTGEIDSFDFGIIGDVVYDTTLWLRSSVGIHTLSNVGIGTTNPTNALTVRGGDISVGVSTSHGVILTSPNGTQYRLIVNNAGALSTIAV